MNVDGHPAHALLDSGLLRDFISSILAVQLLAVRRLGVNLDTPLSVQLVIQRSRSKVNAQAMVRIQYQGIDESRTQDMESPINDTFIGGREGEEGALHLPATQLQVQQEYDALSNSQIRQQLLRPRRRSPVDQHDAYKAQTLAFAHK